MTFFHFLEVKFITEAKDFCVFFDGSYKNDKIPITSIFYHILESIIFLMFFILKSL